MNLTQFPRVRLGHLPTPLEPMERLTKTLGGPSIFVKRDDCTGLAGGGNKVRKLEYLIAAALKEGADTVITQGATQSNHARQTAAAAALYGLSCVVILEDRTGFEDEEYRASGNVFLDELLGADVRRVPGGTDMDAALAEVAAELRAAGRRPYVIPGGGSNTIGTLGYVQCAMEIVQQANDRGLKIADIVHGTGSAGTQAGLVAGLEIMHADISVLGISVRAAADSQIDKVHALASATAECIAPNVRIRRDRIRVDDRFVGPGYGVPTEEMVHALELVARTQGLLLDPVYSGKAMAGLIQLVREGFWSADANVVFLHTGGSAALFGYRWAFADGMGAS